MICLHPNRAVAVVWYKQCFNRAYKNWCILSILLKLLWTWTWLAQELEGAACEKESCDGFWNINRLKGDYLINVASNCAGIFNYFQHGILFSQKCLLFHCFYINFNCGRPMNFSHHFCPGCGGVIRCQSDLGGAYHRSLARTNLRRNHVKLSCVKTGSLSSNQGGWVVPWFRGCIVTHGNGWDKGMNWYHEFKYGVLVFVKVYRYTVPKAVLY